MERDLIAARLESLRDGAYAAFQRKLIPTVPPYCVIGVRAPEADGEKLRRRFHDGKRGVRRAGPHPAF